MASMRIEQMADEFVIYVSATGSDKEDILGKGKTPQEAALDAMAILVKNMEEMNKQIDIIYETVFTPLITSD